MRFHNNLAAAYNGRTNTDIRNAAIMPAVYAHIACIHAKARYNVGSGYYLVNGRERQRSSELIPRHDGQTELQFVAEKPVRLADLAIADKLANTRGAYHLPVETHILDYLHNHSVFSAKLRKPLGSAVPAETEPEIPPAARESRVQPLVQKLADKILIGKRADLGEIGSAKILHAHFIQQLALVLKRDDVLGTLEFRERGIAVERKHGGLQILLRQCRAYYSDVSQMQPVKIPQRDSRPFGRRRAVCYINQIYSPSKSFYRY